MSNKLKRNFLKLIKDIKEDGTVEYETYFTPHFMPFRKIYEASDLLDSMGEKTEKEQMNAMMDYVCDLYGNQFKRDKLLDGLHAPDAANELKQQITFVASGAMEEDRKAELKKMLA